MDNKAKNIIETASLLFSQKGIKATSVDEIAKICGISKKTFYHFFMDKEMIISEIVQNLLIKTEQYARILPEISPNASSELINFFQYLQTNFFVFNSLFINDLKKYYPNIYNLILENRRKKLIPFFIKNIEHGISEEIYRKHLDSKITGELYFLLLDNVIDDIKVSESERYNIVNYINSFFLHGIMNQNGLKLSFTNFK